MGMRGNQLSHNVLACFYFVDATLQKLRAVLEASLQSVSDQRSMCGSVPARKTKKVKDKTS